MDLIPYSGLCWMGILKNNGILNNFLMWTGIIDQPLIILHTNLAVYIGVVYSYLPFMVLPIYTALTRLDYSLVEAALDLGAKPFKTFISVIVPLTKGALLPAPCWCLSPQWVSLLSLNYSAVRTAL